MNGIKEIILFVICVLIMIAINGIIILLTVLLSPKKDYQHVFNKKMVIWGCVFPICLYLGLNIISTCGKVLDGLEKDHLMQNIIIERGGAFLIILIYFLYKIIIAIKQYDLKINNVFPYIKYSENGENKYYVATRYKKIGKELKIISYIIAFVFAFGEAVFVFNNHPYFDTTTFLKNYLYIICICIIYLTIYEIGVFLDGEIQPEVLKQQNEINKEDQFTKMLLEYKQKFNNYLLLTLDKDENITDDNVVNKDDYIYSKIFTPIIEGRNIIVETENIYILNDIIPPLLNLIFGTNRKIMFITENDNEAIATFEWLKKCKVLTKNQKEVVKVFADNFENMVLLDNNVDICIGTVDKLLENKEITKYADTIFAINIDNIIVNSPIELSILTKVLSREKNKNVQYILFSNEVNGLQQSIEGVFYSEDFLYQVVRQKKVKNFHTMFYAKEKGRIHKEILPGIANDSIGSILPLLITPIKYGFEHLFAISSSEPNEDEMISLHKNAPFLKTYVNNTKINDVADKIEFLQNEHFAENLDSMIVTYDDAENNLILLINNYIKYAQSRILVNIVSDKYLLRDYMIDNMDFLMQNHKFLGKIVPIHKNGKKLLLFKLINELCLNELEEDYLIMELNKLTNQMFNPNDVNNTESYIKESFIKLIDEVFGVKIYMEQYLYKEFYSQTYGKIKYSYKLSDEIKEELPSNLFKQIKFVTAEQKYKNLNSIPLYEMYQNYAIGQYVVFNGKSYIIDNINDREGVVTLISNEKITNTTYRQKKDITYLNINNIERIENSNDYGTLTYERKILNVDFNVKYSGYYEFPNGINFDYNNFKYQNNNIFNADVVNEYKSQKAVLITFKNAEIDKFDDEKKLKISETLAFLLNEASKTIYYGANQYLIIRAITKNNLNIYGEVNDLYSPINVEGFDDGIGILVIEDTELEKGILDSFSLNFDNTILPLITDYLEWALDDTMEINKMEQMKNTKNVVQVDDIYVKSYNGDRINFYSVDKLEFLKLGRGITDLYFDLKSTLDILRKLSISGVDSITSTRKNFINKRTLICNIKNNIENNKANIEEKTVENIKENVEEKIVNDNVKENVIDDKVEENIIDDNVVSNNNVDKNDNLSKDESSISNKKEKTDKKSKFGLPFKKNDGSKKTEKKSTNNDTDIDNSMKKLENDEKDTKENITENTMQKNISNEIPKNQYKYLVGENVTKKEVVEFLENNIYNKILNSKKNIDNVKTEILKIKNNINKDDWNVYTVVNYVLNMEDSMKGKSLTNLLKSNKLPNVRDVLNDFIIKFGIKVNKELDNE